MASAVSQIACRKVFAPAPARSSARGPVTVMAIKPEQARQVACKGATSVVGAIAAASLLMANPAMAQQSAVPDFIRDSAVVAAFSKSTVPSIDKVIAEKSPSQLPNNEKDARRALQETVGSGIAPEANYEGNAARGQQTGGLFNRADGGQPFVSEADKDARYAQLRSRTGQGDQKDMPNQDALQAEGRMSRNPASLGGPAPLQ